MSGPGWMPSRPRPLPRSRRGWAYTPAYVQRRRKRRRTGTTAHEPVDLAGLDGPPVELPTATLLPGPSEGRYRALGEDLRHWITPRWAWLRPRAVPLLAALIGMFAVIGLEKYLSELARGDHAPASCYYETPSFDVVELSPSRGCGGAPPLKRTIRYCNVVVSVTGCR